MKWDKIKNLISTLNVIRRYRTYKYDLKELEECNTLNVAEFLDMDNDKRDLTLFCLTAALKIKQEANTKLLWAILGVLGLSTSGVAYLGVS